MLPGLLPDREKHTISKDEMIASIMVALGGRAAEELVFNRLESGAYSDFVTATDIARAMVCSYGMSKALDLLCISKSMGKQLFRGNGTKD